MLLDIYAEHKDIKPRDQKGFTENLKKLQEVIKQLNDKWNTRNFEVKYDVD